MTQQRISTHDLRGMRRAARKRLIRAELAFNAALSRKDRTALLVAYARLQKGCKAYYLVSDELCARLGVEVYP